MSAPGIESRVPCLVGKPGFGQRVALQTVTLMAGPGPSSSFQDLAERTAG